MRVYAIYLFIGFFALYAYRDWFKSLCALILLMAVIEHPDMPKTILGVPGLNPWNLLLVNVVAGWAMNRRREGLVWDMPRHVNVLLALYAIPVMFGFIRMMGDRGNIWWLTTAELVSENLINTVKWVVPSLLLFDGARTRKRMLMALVCILGVYFLLAAQVIRWMPLNAIVSGDALEQRSGKILANEIGYHRVNMSMMLAGASWAVLCMRSVVSKRAHVLMVFAAAAFILFGQALTGGRMGYVTWGVVGLALCVLRWRRYLPIVPLVVLLVPVLVPSVAERMFQGFGEQTASGGTEIDDHAVTAGRTLIWPFVVQKIGESPVVGYGRQAMYRTGLARYLRVHLNEEFGHPHNAYLEWAMDNGLPALALIIAFYGIVVLYSLSLFRDTQRPLFSAVGGVALAFVLTLLFAAMGSQTFYPREGAFGMWAAMGLMFRAWVLRSQSIAAQRAGVVGAHQSLVRRSPQKPRMRGMPPATPVT